MPPGLMCDRACPLGRLIGFVVFGAVRFLPLRRQAVSGGPAVAPTLVAGGTLPLVGMPLLFRTGPAVRSGQ
ncbi:hypothetical protein ACWD04_29595 [Streptomyces sp. NPDC002911]